MCNGLWSASAGNLFRMRIVFFAYFVVEVLAFLGVARLIGIGWAFLAVFALSVIGGVAANIALRNSLRRTAGGQSSLSSLSSLGRLAGDGALLMVGWVLCILPGFVSSVVGLLMIFPPTRALLRRSLTERATRSVEDFGMRVYSASPIAQQHTSYGTFTPEPTGSQSGPQTGSDRVINVEELERWYREDAGKNDTDKGE